MNYPESAQILEQIKGAKKILVNSHRSPDPDSVSSALAMYIFLKELGKEAEVICVDPIPEYCKFLPFSQKIKQIDVANFNFGGFDLFIVLDSSQWRQALGTDSKPTLVSQTIVIDHHHNNPLFGNINLLDPKSVSTTEVLYNLFLDFNCSLKPQMATCLFTGIISDSNNFTSGKETPKSFSVCSELIKKGADKDLVLLNLFKSYNLGIVNLVGEILRKMNVDKKHNFVWAAMPYDESYRDSDLGDAKSIAVEQFGRTIKSTKFGLVIVQTQDKKIRVSFRARENFDTSKIARMLGGDGHPQASAARISATNFNEGVKRILEACRKVVEESV